MVFVQGGSFNMGNDAAFDDEKPIHKVSLDSYYIGKYPVTVGQYRLFCDETDYTMPDAPDWGWQEDHPMVNVSYYDAWAYCDWLSRKYGGEWNLPTEAEWEYAARGGKESKGYKFSGTNDPQEAGWFKANSEGRTHAVGSKAANELGIFDMSGNTYEWCRDWYAEDYYYSSPEMNPRGPAKGVERILRSGGWAKSPVFCRVSHRCTGIPSNRFSAGGFRVAYYQRGVNE